MKIFLRRLFISIVAILLIFVVSALVILSFFEKSIGKKLIQSINENLKTEIQIKDFDLSMLRSFPYASVDLQDVCILDLNQDSLLSAAHLSFRFKLLSLFGTNIEINTVVAENGGLLIHYNPKGEANYDIFKTVETVDSVDRPFNISLKEARLKNVRLRYIHRINEHAADFQVKEAVFGGDFSSKEFSLASKARLYSQFVEFNRDRYLLGKPIEYDAKVKVNLQEGRYQLDKMVLNIASSEFDVDGSIEQGKDFTNFDLIARNEGGNLENLLQLLPPKYLAYLGDFKSKGALYFNALIDGRLDENQNPLIDIEFGLNDAQVNSPRMGMPLEKVTLKTHFNNGKARNNKSSYLDIEELSGYFGTHRLQTQLVAKDLRRNHLMLNFKVDGALPLQAIYGLFEFDKVKNGDGIIKINDLQLKGLFNDMISMNRIPNVDIVGDINFEAATIQIAQEKLRASSGQMTLDDNQLSVKSVRIDGAGSSLTLNGDFFNLVPVLFADSLNSKEAELEFVATLDAQSLDLDRLVGLTTANTSENLETAVIDSIHSVEVQKREKFTEFLSGVIKVDVDSFNYNKIEGTAFVGKIQFANNEMNVSGEADGMDGAFAIDGSMHFEDEPFLTAKIESKSVNLEKFFYQSNNFTQNFITNQHLRGNLDSRIAINAFWDNALRFQYDQLEVLGELTITDGEMLDFELFNNFSSYIHEESLKHVRFADLKNWFEIKRQKIYIPVMFVQTNATNLTLNGNFAFDQQFDFNIKVNAAQVLATKMKSHNRKLSFLPAKKKGWFNLYYKVHGKPDDMDYEMAKKEIKADFERSERRKSRIQRSLERTFGEVPLLQEPPAWLDDALYFSASEEELDLIFEQAVKEN